MEMSISTLLPLWEGVPVFLELCAAIQKGDKSLSLSGLWGGAEAFFISGLHYKLKKGILIVVAGEEEAEKLKQDIECFAGKNNVFLFPLDDNYTRLKILSSIYELNNPILIASSSSLKQKTISSAKFKAYSFKIEKGEKISREEILKKLIECEYNRAGLVEDKGQFSVRGEILDIWPPDRENPVRVVFYGDEIELLNEFEVDSQRSSNKIGHLRVIPASESEEVSVFDYLPDDFLVFIDNFSLTDHNLIIPANYVRLNFFSLSQETPFIFMIHPMVSFGKKFEIFYNEKKKWNKEGFKVFIFCNNDGERKRIDELLREKDDDLNNTEIIISEINKGFIFPELKLVAVTDNEIFNRYKVKHYFPAPKNNYYSGRVSDLNNGDYVVHEKYGIGRYLGLSCLSVAENREKDFLTIEYDKGDKLYVPVEDFNLVQKYSGQEGRKVHIYSLDGIRWDRVKKRVKKKMQEMAKQLLHLYAARKTLKGHAFFSNLPYEEEFSGSFIYEETADQKRAIEEVAIDMQSPRPMDRLICGDVGYGKTEVAMRASFKAVLDNKQVAVLVPTTILAEQHFNTFQERFRDYPVVIQMLSRFRTKKEQKSIIKTVKEGKIDIIIGTHRLLQKDIQFKNLGLLIIDEEQRFGVRAKEKLKEIRAVVDVLTISATPIPRTLSLSLDGLRDMSVIDTPPWGRLPIRTYVGKYNEEIIRKAITAEIDRGGQVFFVHNRIETIESLAERLKKLLPQIKIAVAHGQMKSNQLEDVMCKFINKEYNILISTTIIETGLDIPNVNTMIINQADNFGLSQLYQLRGRIGRDKYQAYAYLFYSDEKNLSLEAKKRLESIAEFTELGSGFKIALRDLEIRGAGNVLGAQQHGNMLEIGIDLYCKLLAQTIKKMKGDDFNEPVQPKIDINLNIHIPATYIMDTNQRIIIYKRMMNISEKEQIEGLRDELNDRFGNIPKEVDDLFWMLELRVLSQKLNISEIKKNNNILKIKFLPETKIETEKILNLAKDFPDNIKFAQEDSFEIKIKINDLTERKELINFLKKILQKLL